MEGWVRKNFDVDAEDNVSWVSENGKKTSCNIQTILERFDSLNVSYADFSGSVAKPIDNPLDNGVNWGNHVRAWQDQGKFEVEQ